jgi:translation initiation factor eIF-2B subunit gamma
VFDLTHSGAAITCGYEMSAVARCYAVILAGGEGSRLFPLNAAGMPKVLMPVANRPLLTFPLRMLEEGGVTDLIVVSSCACTHALGAQLPRPTPPMRVPLLRSKQREQVCEGDGAAVAVKSWLSQYIGLLQIEVIRVSAGLPSVAALRQVMDKVKSDHFVLLSGDVVTEAPLRAQMLMHHLKGAAVTALFGRRKTSPAADTQPGKAPRNVDYVGTMLCVCTSRVCFEPLPG